MSKPQAFIVFCENVREEKGDKLSLMGILGPEIRFVGLEKDENLTTNISVVLLFRLFEPGPHEVEFSMHFKGGAENVALPPPPENQSVTLKLDQYPDVWTTQVIATLVGLPIHHGMSIAVSAKIGEVETIAPITFFVQERE